MIAGATRTTRDLGAQQKLLRRSDRMAAMPEESKKPRETNWNLRPVPRMLAKTEFRNPTSPTTKSKWKNRSCDLEKTTELFS
jgi:hypothetical protein